MSRQKAPVASNTSSKKKVPTEFPVAHGSVKLSADKEKIVQSVAHAVGEEVELVQPYLEMCNWNKDIVIRKFEESLSVDVERLCASNKIETALSKCQAYIEHGKATNNYYKQALATYEMAYVAYKHQSNAEVSLKFTEQSVALLKQMYRPDKLALAIVCNHAGVCLYYLNRIEEAVEQLEIALDYVYNMDDGEEATILSNLANTYYHTKQYKMAKLYFERALAKRLKKHDSKQSSSVQKIKGMLEVLTF